MGKENEDPSTGELSLDSLTEEGCCVDDTVITGATPLIFDFNTGTTLPSGLVADSFGTPDNGTVSITESKLQISIPASSARAGVALSSALDFTNRKTNVKLVQPCGGTDKYTAFIVSKDGNNLFSIQTHNNVLEWFKKLGGTLIGYGSKTYNSTTHAYWQIRHAASTGEIVFEASSDGTNYTPLGTVSASGIDLTLVNCRLLVSSVTSNDVTDPAKFDDFQVLPLSGSRIDPNPRFGFAKLSSWAAASDPFAQAITDLSADQLSTLLIDINATLSSSVVVPENIVLQFANRAKITKSGSGAIEFLGVGIDAPPEIQIFSGFAAGNIKWTSRYPSFVSPVWFGGKGDSSTDNLVPINSCVAAFQAIDVSDPTAAKRRIGGKIFFPPAENGKGYLKSDLVHIYRSCTIEGADAKSTPIITAAGKGGFYIHRDNSYVGTPPGGSGSDATDTYLKNLWIKGLGGTPTDSSNAAQTFTANISGLTLTRTGGKVIDNRDFRQGQTCTFNGMTHIVAYGVDTGAQTIRLEPPRFVGSITSGSNVLDKNSYQFWQTNQFAGAIVNIGGSSFTVISNTASDGNGLGGALTLQTTCPFNYNHGTINITSLKPQTAVTIEMNLAHGITSKALFKTDNVLVENFSGNGFDIDTDYYPPGTSGEVMNANSSHIMNCFTKGNRGHGSFTAGINSNVILYTNFFAQSNYGWGQMWRDFHGGTAVNSHTLSNHQGTYGRTNDGRYDQDQNNNQARAILIGCYAEGGDQPRAELNNTLIVGGNMGGGISTGTCSIQGVSGMIETTPIKATTRYANETIYPTAFQIGAFPGANESMLRTVAGFGVPEDSFSFGSTNRLDLVFCSVLLNYSNLARNFYMWEYANFRAAMGISSGLYHDSGGWPLFPRGLLIGDTNNGKERYIGYGSAAPTGFKTDFTNNINVSGTTVNWRQGYSKFDTSGKWDDGKCRIKINDVYYAVQTVTSDTTLTLAASAGSGTNIGGTFETPYRPGDFIFNDNPTSTGSVLGWRCIAGGRPGTWQEVTVGGGSGGNVPAGGTTGQSLVKASNTNYDTTWSTISSGGGGGTTTTVKRNLAGGALTGGWLASDVSFGAVYNGTGTPNLTGLTNPGPAALYQKALYGTGQDIIDEVGFTPNSTVKFRAHINIDVVSPTPDYTYNIEDVNSSAVMHIVNYTGSNIPLIQEMNVTADSTGKAAVKLKYLGGTYPWLISGAEFIQQ